jgi:predicted RNase H-like nuclease
VRVALGIDAAWTATQPSGVALAVETAQGWRLKAVASSYARFREVALAGEATSPARGEAPDPAALLDACRLLAGRAPDLIAVDMPLALTPIVGRRTSDRAISSAFGAAKAATHSPSEVRPGKLADRLCEDFKRAGYGLCTADGVETPGIMEVYPHAALLALSGDKTRLTYKAGKTTTYWRDLDRPERLVRLADVWRRIVELLETRIAGVAVALPLPEMRGRALKDFEDRLDAVVCAWVAIAALDGRARAFGDAESAIWVPVSGLTAG